LPINVMQNRLVKHKILGGAQRFRSATDFSPMSLAFDAIRRTAEAELSHTAPSEREGGALRLRVMAE
jgi:hypothetical protein